ncbi:MAG: prepilin-type N-terminal cleavage/methylation domain-containing protein [Phycisphaerales bacterium]|jgi:prepilin-type N-terminal cleavage/methylation domain-containing protein
MRRGFTLIEILVVIAIIAVLLGVLLPVLAGARDAGRAAVCLSNLRQAHLICAQYADEYDGFGPAIGQPYAALPNWALVVQTEAKGGAGRAGTGPGEVFEESGILVCPACQAQTGERMTRTYAMNATGLAGQPGDAGDYDARPTSIRFNLVSRPAETPLLVDAAPTPPGPGQPPRTRTASVIDFRQDSHVAQRLGLWHGGRASARCHAVRFDGSARAFAGVESAWLEPLR